MATTTDLVQFAATLWTKFIDNYDYLSSSDMQKAINLADAITGLVALPEEIRNAAGESQRTNNEMLLRLRSDALKWVAAKRASKNQYVFTRQCDE